MKKYLAFITILFFSSQNAHAQEQLRSKTDDTKGIITLAIENDSVTGQDNGYTSGVRLSWLSSESGMPEVLDNAAKYLPFIDEKNHNRVGISVGQNIYTPDNTETSSYIPGDRPYAGWLYTSVGLVSDTGKTLDTYQITVGMVGPSSLAQQSQESVHTLIGAAHPQGWDNQLRDEPGVIFTYDHKWKSFYRYNSFGLSFDATPQIGANLGNIYTNVNTGITFRLGMDLPEDYGPPLIQPNLTGSDFFIPTDSLGWYVFAGLEGQAIARNIFLDGNTWRDSPSVDKEVFVGGVQAGAALTFNNTRLAYTYALRSKEFKGQETADSYGAITLSYRF